MKQRTCSVNGILMECMNGILMEYRGNAFLTLHDLQQIFEPLQEFIGLNLVQKKKEGKGARERREQRRRETDGREKKGESKEDKIFMKEPSTNWDKEGLWIVNNSYSKRHSDLGVHDNLSRTERKAKRGEERWIEEQERSFTNIVITMEKSFYPTYCGLCGKLQGKVIHQCTHRDEVVMLDSRNNMTIRAANIQTLYWGEGTAYQSKSKFDMIVTMSDMKEIEDKEKRIEDMDMARKAKQFHEKQFHGKENQTVPSSAKVLGNADGSVGMGPMGAKVQVPMTMGTMGTRRTLDSFE